MAFRRPTLIMAPAPPCMEKVLIGTLGTPHWFAGPLKKTPVMPVVFSSPSRALDQPILSSCLMNLLEQFDQNLRSFVPIAVLCCIDMSMLVTCAWNCQIREGLLTQAHECKILNIPWVFSTMPFFTSVFILSALVSFWLTEQGHLSDEWPGKLPPDMPSHLSGRQHTG